MKISKSLKPAVLGAAAGAIALAIVGFSWGGWMTAGTANQMAAEQARADVVAALVPICVEQSKADPLAAQTLAQMKDVNTYQRNDLLLATGWATMPGATEPDRYVAKACMDELALKF
jgi:hypothetical protein